MAKNIFIVFYVFMEVSFTGFKNLSYGKDFYGAGSKDCIIQHFWNVELTNDKFGNDLSKLQKLIEKYKTERQIDITNPLNKNFLNIFYFVSEDGSKKAFSINGIVLPVNRITLPIFDFIAEMTKKVSQTPEALIPIEEKYLKSESASKALLIKEHINTHVDNVLNMKIEDLHRNKHSIKAAKKINNGIVDTMWEYFASDIKKNPIKRKADFISKSA